MPIAYIYLVRMADGVYKVGRTEQDFGLDLKRFRAYPRDATVIFIRTCSELDVTRYETQILRTLKDTCGFHPRGKEYVLPKGPRVVSCLVRIINDIMDSDPQTEFFKTLAHGPDRWTPLVFLQARFDIFCRSHRYTPRPLDVETVFEARGCVQACELVEGVSIGIDLSGG